jgi:hypothetical protein
MSLKQTLIWLAMFLSGPAVASNFAQCILEKMPGSANQAMHAAIFQTCARDHPTQYRGIEKGEGRGLFGFSDGNACTIKKAAGTTFQPSAYAIARACKCLYDAPNPFDKPDPGAPGPVLCAYE